MIGILEFLISWISSWWKYQTKELHGSIGRQVQLPELVYNWWSVCVGRGRVTFLRSTIRQVQVPELVYNWWNGGRGGGRRGRGVPTTHTNVFTIGRIKQGDNYSRHVTWNITPTKYCFWPVLVQLQSLAVNGPLLPVVKPEPSIRIIHMPGLIFLSKGKECLCAGIGTVIVWTLKARLHLCD